MASPEKLATEGAQDEETQTKALVVLNNWFLILLEY
jgi:hypothetical protein